MEKELAAAAAQSRRAGASTGNVLVEALVLRNGATGEVLGRWAVGRAPEKVCQVRVAAAERLGVLWSTTTYVNLVDEKGRLVADESDLSTPEVDAFVIAATVAE